MAKVDLDYVQARVDKAGDVRHGFVLLPIEDAQDMVAELRATREAQDNFADLLYMVHPETPRDQSSQAVVETFGKAVVAELRAAREVVEAQRAVERKDSGCYGRLHVALAAYDQAVASISPLTTPTRRP